MSSLKELTAIVERLERENKAFRDNITQKVEKTVLDVARVTKPANLESDIISSIQTSLHKSIENVLTGYNSPLNSLITNVVNNNIGYLNKLIGEAFTAAITTDQFRNSIVDAFTKKVARNMISLNDGLFDKISNEMKQDVQLKSRMILAISDVLNEFLNERKVK